MLLRRSAVFIVILTLTTGLVVPLGVASVPDGDITAVWKDYNAAQKHFHYDLANLLTDMWPRLSSIADLQRDLQFALVEMINVRFQYLLEHDPDRLVFDQGLETLSEFDWTEKDNEALRAANPQYEILESWVEKFTKELTDHKDLSEADQKIYSLHNNDYYRSMIERYQLRLTDIETALKLTARSK